MFTGLIQDMGEITASSASTRDRVVVVRPRKILPAQLALGASIACNGVCLTVTERDATGFKAHIAAETMEKTTAAEWQVGTRLNLEPSLKLGDELGGHMVSGHVDGVARCEDVHADGQGVRLAFSVPEGLAAFIAPKGSVAINGVSLTVNEVQGSRFGVLIIPHTAQETTLGALRTGEKVNIEVDMLARYVARILESRKSA